MRNSTPRDRRDGDGAQKTFYFVKALAAFAATKHIAVSYVAELRVW